MNQGKGPFNCPVEATLALIGGKYKPLILWHLIDGPRHYMALQRLIPAATAKMLSQQLRGLEADGLVRREVLPETPPRTRYSLTEFGRSVIPVLTAMCDWGAACIETVGGRTGQNKPCTIKCAIERSLK